MGKKIKAPPGLDYQPVIGETPNLSFGVGQAAVEGGGVMTAETFVGRRLFPVGKPKDFSQPWGNPTCYRHDVMLPGGASDELADPQRLCQAYDRACFGNVRDIAVIVTLRFPETEVAPQQLCLHEAWELCRSFALRRLVQDRGIPLVLTFHVPSRAARPGAPHVHLLALPRQLLPSGFGLFSQPFASDEGRELMDQEWSKWRERSGR